MSDLESLELELRAPPGRSTAGPAGPQRPPPRRPACSTSPTRPRLPGRARCCSAARRPGWCGSPTSTSEMRIEVLEELAARISPRVLSAPRQARRATPRARRSTSPASAGEFELAARLAADDAASRGACSRRRRRSLRRRCRRTRRSRPRPAARAARAPRATRSARTRSRSWSLPPDPALGRRPRRLHRRARPQAGAAGHRARRAAARRGVTGRSAWRDRPLGVA